MPKTSFRVTASRSSGRFMVHWIMQGKSEIRNPKTEQNRPPPRGALFGFRGSCSNCDAAKAPDHLDREEEGHGKVEDEEARHDSGRLEGEAARGARVHVEGRQDGDRIERLEPVPELVPDGALGGVERTDGR